MIEIRTNGRSFDLLPNTTIRVEMSNPLWEFESIPGTHVLPFNLPDTDRNRDLLQYAKVIMRKAVPMRRLDCEIRLLGLPFISGKMIVHKSTHDGYSVYIVSEAGDFRAYVEGKGLRDLELGGTRLIGNSAADVLQYMKDTTTGTVEDYDLVYFPIQNATFGLEDDQSMVLKGTLPGQYPDIARDASYICPVQNYWYNGDFYPIWFQAGTSPGSHNTAWPFNLVYPIAFPYLKYILQEIFSLGDYKLGGTWMDDAEISTLVLNNLYIQQYRDYPQPQTINLSRAMPVVGIADFLKALRKMFCLAMIFDSRRKVAEVTPMREILRSTKVEEWTSMADPRYEVTDEEFEEYRFEFDLDTNDLNCADKVKDLDVVPKEAAVNTEASLPLTDAPGTHRLVLSKWYWWSINPDQTAWAPSSLPLGPFGPESSSKRIQSIVSPVASYEGEDTIPADFFWVTPVTRSWKIPWIEQPGTFNLGRQFSADGRPRLLFYRGMWFDSNADLYPMGISDNYDNAGTRLWDYSLAWEGEDGLYDVWWQDYVEFFRNTRRVTRRVALGIEQLLNLDMLSRKRISGVDYFIEKLTVQIGMKGIEPAELTLLKA